MVNEYRGVRPGLYIPNEFDLIDLNALSDIVHRRIIKVLRDILREHEIDQQFDFKILRADRDKVLDPDQNKPS